MTQDVGCDGIELELELETEEDQIRSTRRRDKLDGGRAGDRRVMHCDVDYPGTRSTDFCRIEPQIYF